MGWTIASAVTFSVLLVLTAATQSRRFRWTGWIKRYDVCAYLPRWTFFAPIPYTGDIRLLWREQLSDGTVSTWSEFIPPSSTFARAVWHRHWRVRKGVIDCAPVIVREMAGDRKSPLSMLGLRYLMVVQLVAGLPGSALSIARQFTVVNVDRSDDDEGAVQVLCVSNWHRQHEVS
jgi:hypothetical protein